MGSRMYGNCAEEGLFQNILKPSKSIYSVAFQSTIYYIDATEGDDGNSGLFQNTPWETISKINSESFNPGDSILFKRGETWRERLVIPSSGTENRLITFGAYATGDNPLISAFDSISIATWVGPNVNGEYTHDEGTVSYVFLEDKNNLLRATAGSLNAGEWAYSAGKIYYKPTTGTPVDHICEKCIRVAAVEIDTKDNLLVEDLSLEGQNTEEPVTSSVFSVIGSSNITIQNSNSSFGNGSGISFTKNSADRLCSNVKAINNIVKRCGALNIKVTYTDGALVQGNTVFESGINHYHTTDDMEGIGTAYVTDMIIEENTVYGNGFPDIDDSDYGTGIKVDNATAGQIAIRKNKIYDNQHAGIFLTGDWADTTIDVSQNLIYNNGLNEFTGVLGYFGGVVVNTLTRHMGTANIHNNTVWGNTGNNTENNRRQGNIFTMTGDGRTANFNVKNNIVGNWKHLTQGSDFNFQKLTTGNFNIVSNYNLLYRGTSGRMIQWTGCANTPYTGAQWAQYVIDSGQDVDSPISADPLFVDEVSNDYALTYLSPAIDAGTDMGLTTDYFDNPIYGTPDIGAIAYQPPYTMGTDAVNIAGDIRIYRDGKFRNTSTVSGATANLTVTPEEGFGTGDYSEWMNIEADMWSEAMKKWTETPINSSIITVHIVGDLTPATSYDIFYTKSGESKTLLANMEADAGGQLTFTYDQEYSPSVIFEIEL